MMSEMMAQNERWCCLRIVTASSTDPTDSASLKAPLERAGLALGSYSGYAAIGLDGYRFIAKYPVQSETHLFADSDLLQENELTGKFQNEETHFSAMLDTLLKLADYTLERGF